MGPRGELYGVVRMEGFEKLSVKRAIHYEGRRDHATTLAEREYYQSLLDAVVVDINYTRSPVSYAVPIAIIIIAGVFFVMLNLWY